MLTAILFMSLFQGTARASGFSDTGSHWARVPIEKWNTAGLVQGYQGRFHPDDPITRGEMAVILDRLMRYTSPIFTFSKSDTPFSDLTDYSAYYYMPMVRAYRWGDILGSGNNIRPMDYLIREEAVTMLGRAFGIAESGSASGFADAASISPWAAGFVNAMAEKGYVNGYASKFSPKAKITRAEIVQIIDNSITYVSSLNKANVPEELNGIVIINIVGDWMSDKTINGDLIIAPGSAGIVCPRITNVTVNGNMSLQAADRVDIDGGSYIKMLTFEKCQDFTYLNARSTVIVLDDQTVVEKAYSKVKYAYVSLDIPIEYAPGVWDN